MKKICVYQGLKKLSFIVSNNDWKGLNRGDFSVRECLTISQQKKLDRTFTAWEYSHLKVEFLKEWSWTIDEMVDDIEECGGYDNFDHSSPLEIYKWVKEQYPCTKENGMRIAEICADNRLVLR